jgi:hypothetical protein
MGIVKEESLVLRAGGGINLVIGAVTSIVLQPTKMKVKRSKKNLIHS